MQSISYIQGCLDLVVERCDSRHFWLLTYIKFIQRGLECYRKKRINNPSFRYPTTVLEKDVSFIRCFLSREINKYNDYLQTRPSVRSQIEDFIDILEHLYNHLELSDSREWIEELYPQKNTTPCLDSDWKVPFDKYPKDDQEFFLTNPDSGSGKIKQYLFFIQVMEDLLLRDVNPFQTNDPNVYIAVATFENMLIKIVNLFHQMSLTQTDLKRLRLRMLVGT